MNVSLSLRLMLLGQRFFRARFSILSFCLGRYFIRTVSCKIRCQQKRQRDTTEQKLLYTFMKENICVCFLRMTTLHLLVDGYNQQHTIHIGCMLSVLATATTAATSAAYTMYILSHTQIHIYNVGSPQSVFSRGHTRIDVLYSVISLPFPFASRSYKDDANSSTNDLNSRNVTVESHASRHILRSKY